MAKKSIPFNVDVHAVEEGVQVVLGHPGREGPDVRLGVDVRRHAGKHLDLGLVER